MAETAYIALGSNVGDREGHIRQALGLLAEDDRCQIQRVSRLWETLPAGGPPNQELYLNAVAELVTQLTARDLMDRLLNVESRLGRVRTERNVPRSIDLDLLLYGEQVISEPGLVVPHPRLHERAFVLGPLAELAPLTRHPLLGRTVLELLAAVSYAPLGGRRAVVTGSTSGIGQAVVLTLAAAGAQVLIHGRQEESARRVCDRAQRLSGKAWYFLADLRQPRACEELVEHAWRLLGHVDIWVNNAGVDILTGAAARLSFTEKLEHLLAVDLKATVHLSRLAGMRMKHQGAGVIVNVGWDQAETGMEGDSGQLFAAVKGGVMAFTRSLAVELAPQVRVHCVAPGWIRTAWGQQASARWQERVQREVPLGRWGTPEDVAQAVAWLVSDRAAFITGQIIRVNGGAVRA